MLMAVSALFKRFLVKKGISELTAQMTAEVVGEMVESYREAHAEIASQRIGVIDIESDTWYAINMASSDSWEAGFRKWADVLEKEVQRRYFFSQGAQRGRSMTPIRVDVEPSDEGLDIRLTNPKGTSQGIDRAVARAVIEKAVRDTVKAYVRCVATGGQSFPEDYEGA